MIDAVSSSERAGALAVSELCGTMAIARLRRRLGSPSAVVDAATTGSGLLGFSEGTVLTVCARSFGCGMLVSSSSGSSTTARTPP